MTTIGAVLALLGSPSFAFQPLVDTRTSRICENSSFQSEFPSKRRICLHYKSSEHDDASNDENEVSLTRCSTTPLSLTVPIDNVLSTPELWSQDWHDSFVRNGLVDFVPPLSSHLNCLLVGGSDVDYAAADPSPLRTRGSLQESQRHKHEHVVNDYIDESAPIFAGDSPKPEEQQTMMSRLFGKVDGRHTKHHDEDPPLNLDCILDKGLMDELVASNEDRDVGLLLLEATRHLREHGIFIAVTSSPLTDERKEYLVNVGMLLGMQWRFDLDGISNDNVTVSVARKYFTGELPTVGKLATVKRATP